MIHLQIAHVEHVTILEVSGILDASTANTFGEALGHEIDHGHTQIVLDLSSVARVDSAGLRALMQGYKQVKRMAGDLRLAQPSESVYAVLQMLRLNTVFRIYPTRTAAIESY